MKETVKERIMMYLKYKGISKTAFEKSVGLSNGYMTQLRNCPKADKLSHILEIYADLNRNWLLTGDGCMITGGNDEQTGKSPGEKDCLMGSFVSEIGHAMVDKLINHYSLGDMENFAQKLNVSVQTVEKWKIEGRIDAKVVYEKCPDISAVWLLTGKGNMFNYEGQNMERALAEIDYLKGKIAAYENIMRAKGLL